MSPDLAHIGIAILNQEQLEVVRYLYTHELTENQAAVLLTELTGRVYTRNRVHRINLTALDKMRRAITSYLDNEKRAA